MPRHPRHFIPDVPTHVIQRGNNRKACFFFKRDYIVYLQKLREYSLKFDVSIHSFVLMTNHVHLLLTPHTETGISQLLQSLGRYYVRYINSTYSRTGTLWEGRFKASLVDTMPYLLRVICYIELNPVRAKMVNDPAQYPWVSYHYHALGTSIKLLTPHPEYLGLGNTVNTRQKAYLEIINDQIPDLALTQIRKSVNKGWVLGGDNFKTKMEKQLGCKIPPLGCGGDRKSSDYLGLV